MLFPPRLADDVPKADLCRRPLAIACAASVVILVAAASSTPLRAQQAARAERESSEGPAAVKPVEVKTPDADPAAVERANEAALRAEYTEALKPVYRGLFLAELRFIRIAAGIPVEHARRMARASRSPYRAIVAKAVERQIKIEQGKEAGDDDDLDAPFRSARDALAAVAKAELSPEQWARYRDQAEKRSKHRKRITIMNIVAELDRTLQLTAEQRNKLSESLSRHWNAHWEEEGRLLYGAPEGFPNIPAEVITPWLTKTQKAAWIRPEQQEAWVVYMNDTFELFYSIRSDPLAAELDPDEPPAASPR